MGIINAYPCPYPLVDWRSSFSLPYHDHRLLYHHHIIAATNQSILTFIIIVHSYGHHWQLKFITGATTTSKKVNKYYLLAHFPFFFAKTMTAATCHRN